jgi:sulfate/thiosulfate transport system permease protein
MAGLAQLHIPDKESLTRERIRARQELALRATSDPWWMKITVLALCLTFMLVFFALPLGLLFQEALRKGWDAYLKSFADKATMHSVWLSLKVAAIAVPLNTLFGLAAAWCVAHFRFPGRRLLSVLVELPLWVSPVVAGLIYVLLFGRQGLLGPWLQQHDIKIIFAIPGIVLSTIFVTFPFVARVVTPQLESLGRAEEEAALTLGANGWHTFWRITVPKIKWSLIYGIILCNARSMGEFGAVSVVSGHVRNQTNTMPLQIEILYNDYQYVPAFAVASVLALLALLTLVIKSITSWMTARALRESFS